jgi:hypothetical protein
MGIQHSAKAGARANRAARRTILVSGCLAITRPPDSGAAGQADCLRPHEQPQDVGFSVPFGGAFDLADALRGTILPCCRSFFQPRTVEWSALA